MNKIDFTKGVGYKIIRFPDGEVHLQLDELDRKKKVRIVTRICNAEDLFLLMQLSDVLRRQEVVIDSLCIPYLMSARCDRVFSFDRPFSLKIIADVINSLNADSVTILEPHSSRVYDLINNCDYAFPEVTIGIDSTLCFPDKGAQERYGEIFKANSIVCEKIRDVNTGQLKDFKVVNPQVFKSGEITVLDDLCDGGGTFVGLAPKLRELNPTKLRLVVTHAVQLEGIKRVAEVYDEVIISNTYTDWDKESLPSNVKVHLLDFS